MSVVVFIMLNGGLQPAVTDRCSSHVRKSIDNTEGFERKKALYVDARGLPLWPYALNVTGHGLYARAMTVA